MNFPGSDITGNGTPFIMLFGIGVTLWIAIAAKLC
jgi:hypothetical protein